MNEDQNMNQQEQQGAPAQTSQGSDAVEQAKQTLNKLERISGWSWGGFMFGPAYMIATKKYMYLLLYLLMIIPIINILAQIGIAIFMGLKGHQFVAESNMFNNDDERNGFNRAIDHAGFITFLIVLALIIFGFLFFGALMGSLMGGFDGGVPSNISY